MNPLLKSLADQVPADCFSKHCMKEKCKILMSRFLTESGRLVDLDCPSLRQTLGESKRCDFIYLGNADGKVLVVMIELKSGRCKPRDVCEQLQGGATAAQAWLQPSQPYHVVPVLAFGRRIHRRDLDRLRRCRIRLFGKQREVTVMRCGQALDGVL